MQNAAGLPPEMRRPVSACSVAMVYTADATAYARATDRRAYAGSQRRLVAARDIAPGEVVLAETPSLRWVDASCARTVCGWCMRCVEGDPAGGKLHSCAGSCAGRVRWCSAECAAAHRPTHAPVCVLIGHAMPGGALQRRDTTKRRDAKKPKQTRQPRQSAAAAERAHALDTLLGLAIGVGGLR